MTLPSSLISIAPPELPQPSTQGIRLNTDRPVLKQLVELLSSMRFSIALLMVVAAASIIGTVVEQNKPWVNYVNQFGVFWAENLQSVGVFSVYNATWFLLVMAFLVLSLVLCLWRNTAPLLREMRSFKNRMGRAGLLAHQYRGASQYAASLATTQAAVIAHLTQAGYALTIKPSGEQLMVAAKKGTSNRWGYLLAHGGMVVILVGGLLDSEIPLRALAWVRGAVPVQGNQLISSVSESARLPAANPSYRGNVLIPEGASTRNAVVAYHDGVLVQPLPFELTLKKFNIEYYSTGMPKLFTSVVQVHDFDNNTTFERNIIVNEPLTYKGVTIYQSSFDDGGSTLALKGYPLTGSQINAFEVKGTVGESTLVTANHINSNNNNNINNNDNNNNITKPYQVEFSAYRPINVEDLSKTDTTNTDTTNTDTTDTNPSNLTNLTKPFKSNVDRVLGVPAPSKKSLHNVGASVMYKLRDAAGQAKEYHAYQYPVQLDGQAILLLGMRETAGDAFKFIRMPADSDGSITEYMRLRAALANRALQERAAAAFAKHSLAETTPVSSAAFKQLQTSAQKALAIFGGGSQDQSSSSMGGFTAIAQVIDQHVPKNQAEQAANVIVKVLTGAAWEVWQQARVEAGLPILTGTSADHAFLQTALTAYSDSFFLGAPFILQLQTAQHKQASVLQITKSPGKYLVYLGALLLVSGIFAMFYIQERRLWVWLRPINNIKDTIKNNIKNTEDTEHTDNIYTENTHDGTSTIDSTNQTDLVWALSAPKRGFAFETEYQHWGRVLGTKPV